MRGESLGLDVLAVPGEEAVGEGAADVDGDPFHGRCLRVLSATWPVFTGTSRPSGITCAPGRAAHCALSAVDVDLHVERRRMAGRQVLRLDQRAAARAVVLQDPAPRRVRRERELVAVRVDERPVDLARVAVVDERALLVVASGDAEVVLAAAAQPPFGVQVDLEVLGHRNTHHVAPLGRSAAGRLPRWSGTASRRQPHGEERALDHRRAVGLGTRRLVEQRVDRQVDRRRQPGRAPNGRPGRGAAAPTPVGAARSRRAAAGRPATVPATRRRRRGRERAPVTRIVELDHRPRRRRFAHEPEGCHAVVQARRPRRTCRAGRAASADRRLRRSSRRRRRPADTVVLGRCRRSRCRRR